MAGTKKNEIKPWKVKGWVIPPLESSDFVANMELVLDVYEMPYVEAFPVICMDESPRQLIKGNPNCNRKETRARCKRRS